MGLAIFLKKCICNISIVKIEDFVMQFWNCCQVSHNIMLIRGFIILLWAVIKGRRNLLPFIRWPLSTFKKKTNDNFDLIQSKQGNVVFV